MKKLLATMLALVMALTLCATAWADEPVFNEEGVANVSTAAELKAAFLAISSDNKTINITADIDFAGSGVTWDYSTDFNHRIIDGLTINGGNHTISNLNGMLITWGRYITISDLTLENATVDYPDEAAFTAVHFYPARGAAAFVGAIDAGPLTITNCKLVSSTVSCYNYAGGFVGWAGGTSELDASPVTLTNCVVKDSTITGGNSTGGLMGHAMGSEYSSVSVNNATVTNNTITSNDDGEIRAGSILGTVGATPENNVSVSAVVDENRVSSNGTTIDTIYGRRGLDCGTITLTGGSYDKQPLKDADNAWASVDSSVPEATVTNADGVPTSFNYGDSYVQSAAKNATAGQTLTVGGNSDVELTDVPAGVKVMKTNADKTVTVNGVEVPRDNTGVTVYAVTFNSDGGTEVATQNVAAGGKATQPTNPTKDGYVFEHWCLDGSDETAYNFDAPVTSNITLKAHWTVQSSGGTHHFNRPQPTTVTKAESPKTFDAGIAVYGVMAISSVLGMGYVGKKKF